MIEDLDWLPYVVSAFVVGVPALAGALMIFSAVRRWLRVRELAASGERATARVVDNQVESGTNGRMTFSPVVEFETGSGRQVTAVLGDLSGFRSHVAGTEIAVFYDGRSPTDATPAGKGTAGLAVAVVFGLVFLGFAVIAYLFTSSLFDEFQDFGAP
jgi:hypothetical protein